MFDYVILGGGIGGISAAALLAAHGKRVCVIEKHKSVGGVAHTFNVGDFSFVTGAQYLNGYVNERGEPGPLRRFLACLDLDRSMPFASLDPDGYDIVVGPHTELRIPLGIDRLCRRLQGRFPAHEAGLAKYFGIVRKIWQEMDIDNGIATPTDALKSPLRFRTVLAHVTHTVSDVFDKLGFPPELRFLLYGQAGNLAAPASEASFLMQAGMHAAYGMSSVYPTKGMAHFFDGIAGVVKASPGCEIMTDTEVKRIVVEGGEIAHIETSRGPVRGARYISAIDPRVTYALMGMQHKSYAYSDSVVTLNLGFKDLDRKRHGLGPWNTWIHPLPDIDAEFRGLLQEDRYETPWIFVSTSSALTEPGAICPPGGDTMTILTYVPFEKFKRWAEADPRRHDEACAVIEGAFLNAIERRFGLKPEHFAVKKLRSPVDFYRDIPNPSGNVYGPRITPQNFGLFRIGQRTRLANLWLGGPAAGFPGIMGICAGSMDLCGRLLGLGRTFRTRATALPAA